MTEKNKKVANKKPIKKVSKKKLNKDKVVSKTTSELIKTIRHTQQHLDYINDEVVKNAFEIQKLISHMAFMEHNILETRKMIEFVIKNMNPQQTDSLHKKFEIKSVNIINSNKEKEKNDNKKFAMHDNITTRCKNCKSIGLITEDNCKECGAKI